VLVGHVLRGERHGEVGTPVVAVVEGDDRRAAGGVPGDLHGVLDGLGAGVEQGGLLRVVAGVSSARVSHTSTYSSYGVTMKHVWVKSAAPARPPRRRPAGRALPTLVTAMPEPKSISELPSTSTKDPPPPTRRRRADRCRRRWRRTASLRCCNFSTRPRAGDLGDEPALLGKGRAAGGVLSLVPRRHPQHLLQRRSTGTSRRAAASSLR
jgi:hypothetical protein